MFNTREMRLLFFAEIESLRLMRFQTILCVAPMEVQACVESSTNQFILQCFCVSSTESCHGSTVNVKQYIFLRYKYAFIPQQHKFNYIELRFINIANYVL